MRMETSDEALARAAADGDRAAFAALVSRVYDKVFAFGFRLMGTRSDAEDLAQDICLSLPSRLASWRGEGKLSTWLYRVTVNALATGPFVSRMTAFATEDKTKRDLVGKGVPLGRVGRDEDIAGCLLFLCGRGGSYVTGAVIPVSGGINVQTAGNIFADAQ